MAKVGAKRAAELTGKSKSTVQRAMSSGKLSFGQDSNGRRVIDVSELERVFGLKQSTPALPDSAQQELDRAKQLIETERLKMRIKMLEDQLFTANQQIDDLKQQRDKWQKQADQVLITGQVSQKQAEDYRNELKKREQQAREAKEMRRRKMLEERVQRLHGENENRLYKPRKEDTSSLNFQGLWKRVKGE